MRESFVRVLLVEDPVYLILMKVSMKGDTETSLGRMVVGFNLFRLIFFFAKAMGSASSMESTGEIASCVISRQDEGLTCAFSQTGAVQEQMRSKGNRDRPWSNSRGL